MAASTSSAGTTRTATAPTVPQGNLPPPVENPHPPKALPANPAATRPRPASNASTTEEVVVTEVVDATEVVVTVVTENTENMVNVVTEVVVMDVVDVEVTENITDQEISLLENRTRTATRPLLPHLLLDLPLPARKEREVAADGPAERVAERAVAEKAAARRA